MTSIRHQALVELFRQSPSLATTLLASLNVPLAEQVTLRTDDSDLSTVKPVHRHADLIVLVEQAGTSTLAIIVEVQLGKKERKRLAWPVYAILARVRYRCPSAVLVVCPDPSVARWARVPVEIGPKHYYAPWVVGPDEIPAVTSATAARQNVALAVLSAVARANAPVAEAKPVVEAALSACSGLPKDDRLVYSDLILGALGPALQEALMKLPAGYKFQTEIVRRWAAQLESAEAAATAHGITMGEAYGTMQAIATVLERQLTRKFGPISEELRNRLFTASTDELMVWTDRVLAADSLEAVFCGSSNQT